MIPKRNSRLLRGFLQSPIPQPQDKEEWDRLFLSPSQKQIATDSTYKANRVGRITSNQPSAASSRFQIMHLTRTDWFRLINNKSVQKSALVKQVQVLRNQLKAAKRLRQNKNKDQRNAELDQYIELYKSQIDALHLHDLKEDIRGFSLYSFEMERGINKRMGKLKLEEQLPRAYEWANARRRFHYLIFEKLEILCKAKQRRPNFTNWKKPIQDSLLHLIEPLMIPYQWKIEDVCRVLIWCLEPELADKVSTNQDDMESDLERHHQMLPPLFFEHIHVAASFYERIKKHLRQLNIKISTRSGRAKN